jgi:hypothetical protein
MVVSMQTVRTPRWPVLSRTPCFSLAKPRISRDTTAPYMARLQVDSVQRAKYFTVFHDQSLECLRKRSVLRIFEAILLQASLYVLEVDSLDIVIR